MYAYLIDNRSHYIAQIRIIPICVFQIINNQKVGCAIPKAYLHRTINKILIVRLFILYK